MSPDTSHGFVAQAATYAPLFAALADETRLTLVTRLCNGQAHSIAQLTEGLPLTRQAVTKHLRVLETVGLVRSTRAGRQHLFAFNPEPIDGLKAYLEFVASQWDDALGRLKAFVEE